MGVVRQIGSGRAFQQPYERVTASEVVVSIEAVVALQGLIVGSGPETDPNHPTNEFDR